MVPHPLGPGAPASARLEAFVRAYLDLVSAQLDLVLLSETSTPGARQRTGGTRILAPPLPSPTRRGRCRRPGLRAELLLAGVAAEQVRYWLYDEQRDIAVVAQTVSAAALAIARPPD